MMGRYAEAADAYEHAQERVMQDSDSLLRWIELRLRLGGKKFDARTNELVDRAAELSPDDTNVWLLRALSAFDRGDKASADAFIEKLHQRYPVGDEDRPALDAAIASWMGQAAVAATDNAQVPTLPTDSPVLDSNGMPDPKMMVQRLADRLKEHPEDMDGWLRLARSYAVLGRHADANDAYEHAQARAMQDIEALTIWIEMRWRMSGQFDARSQQLLDQAIKLAPDDANVMLLHALSAYSRGDKAGANALIEQLRQRHPAGDAERASLDAAIAQWMPDSVQGRP
jgi:cytochrome c-type biogenesis protein CcmH